MPRGRTESPLDLTERKQLAFDRFAQGGRNAAIARELQVGADTVARYRAEYEASLHEVARDNPRLLQNVVENTIRMLNEADLIKSNAWERINNGDKVEYISVECPECEEDIEVEVTHPISDQNRTALLNTIMKTQDHKAKIYGVFGVKAEFLQQVANVKMVQELLIGWMRNNLCEADRDKLEEFMTTGEMAELMGIEGAPNTIEADQLGELAAVAGAE